MNDTIIFKIQHNVAHIYLNRPEQGNAINLDMAKALLHASIECDQNTDIHCVVLTGTGRFFCAGGDIDEFAQADTQIPAFLSELAGTLHLAISRFKRMQKPLLVAVNGTAAGAGMSLALIGDVVIAHENAQFTPAYGAIGLSPDAGLTWHLPKLVGLRKAQEILVLNQKITAQEAKNIGLITEVVTTEQFEQRQTDLVKQLGQSALPAIANIRKLLLQSHQNSLETHLELEARAIADVSLGKPAKDRLNQFLQKRSAQSKKDK